MTRQADSSDKGTILIIDDEYANLRTLTDMLETENYDVRGATNYDTASMIINHDQPDLILLDIKLPGMSGYEICKELKANRDTADIPVAFLSVLDQIEDKIEAFKSGGIDYISKPFQAEEVLTRVASHLQLSRLRRSLTEEVKRQTEEVEQRLAFEKLILEISTSFSNVSADTIDSVLNQGLKKLGKFVHADRCGLVRRIGLTDDFPVSHLWMSSNLPSDQVLPMPDAEEKRINKVFPWVTEQIKKKKTVALESFENLPKDAGELREWADSINLRSLLLLPLIVDNEAVAFLGIDSFRTDIKWTEENVQRLRLLGDSLINAVLRVESQAELKKAYQTEKQLKSKLQRENVYLRSQVEKKANTDEIIGDSVEINQLLEHAKQVAQTDSTVLILGETGTGKELLAEAIHSMSERQTQTMIKVNCAALPANLIESELFGREKGAYTGAMSSQLGRFELANESTLFLDEIGDLPLELQSKLLRVLQEGTFEMLGSNKVVEVDTRIIAATNHDLKNMVKEGLFRKDLYYRINVFPLTVPPLRERREDIPLLVWAFINEFNKTMGRSVSKVKDQDMNSLKTANWPGNVRELRNIVERSMILSTTNVLNLRKTFDDQSSDEQKGYAVGDKLAAVERSHILKTLEHTGWRVSGKHGAASILGLKSTTLVARMKKLDISRPNRDDS